MKGDHVDKAMRLVGHIEDNNQMAKAAITGLSVLLRECLVALNTAVCFTYINAEGKRTNSYTLAAKIERVLLEIGK